MKVRFADIFDDITRYGTKILKEDYLCKGFYPIVDQGKKFIAGYTDRVNGAIYDLPVIVFGDHTRNIKYVDFPFFLGADGIKVLKCKETFCSVKYLYYYLTYVKIPNMGYNRHFKCLKDLIFDLHLYEEQLEIVRKLDKIALLILRKTEQIEKLDLLVKSKFIKMFSKNIAIENGWTIVPIADITLKPISGEWGVEDTNGTGVKVLRTTNFTDYGIVDYYDVVTRIIEPNKFVDKALRDGDILIEKSGGSDAKPVGRVVFFHKNNENYFFNNFTSVLRCKDERINSYYLFMFLFITYWSGGTKLYENRTTGLHNLKLADYLKKTLIPLPPIELQNQFAAFVEQTDKMKLKIKQSLEKLETLKKSLMQKHFG